MATLIARLGQLVASRGTDRLVAYGLGSCVGVVLREPRGPSVLAHVVLPGPAHAGEDRGPVYFADPGVDHALRAFRELGGVTPTISLFGGAVAVHGLATFDIGRRNVLAVRRALWRAGLVPAEEEVEGSESRTVSVDVASGRVLVQSPRAAGAGAPREVPHEEGPGRR
jgi:chemotaxis protein CheD